MESQAALFAYYSGLGWKIDESSVVLVSDVGGAKKYDVNVASPDQRFGTAQFVERDGVFTAQGFWEEREASFEQRLRAYIRGLEGSGNIFAITVRDVYEADAAALVTAYIGATDVTASNYIVTERNDTFNYRLVI